VNVGDEHASTTEIVESQKRFYDLRAPDYLTGAPSDRLRAGSETGIPASERRAIVDDLRIAGTVLELGCGPGGFTRELARHARVVTAVDSSPAMLARNRNEVDQPNVRYVEADVFAWAPDGQYDVVFFGFLLSHIPPARLAAFWNLVGRCLGPDGRVAFVDEDDRGAHVDDVRDCNGTPTARRKLADGREFDIVKVFWNPSKLTMTLRDLGWNVDVRRVGDSYLVGEGSLDRA